MRAGLATKAVVLGVLVGGCLSVTINVSFPQEKLEGAASSDATARMVLISQFHQSQDQGNNWISLLALLA